MDEPGRPARPRQPLGPLVALAALGAVLAAAAVLAVSGLVLPRPANPSASPPATQGPGTASRSTGPPAGAMLLPSTSTPTPSSSLSPDSPPLAARCLDPSGAPAIPLPDPDPRSRPLEPLPPPRPGEIPILYLHRVEAPPPEYATWDRKQRNDFLRYELLPAAFVSQLDWLRAAGYTTILPRDLAAHWDGRAPLPERPIILTFDDGSSDWVCLVKPLLEARGMVAEFYTTTAFVDGRHLGWEDVRALAAAGNGIGGHGVQHVQLAALGAGRPSASPAEMRAEVDGSRRVIAERIGVAPDSFAYVGGGYDATLAGIVRDAGYTTARTIRRGVLQSPASRYELRVVRIGALDDVVDALTGELVPGLPAFARRISGADPG